MSLSKNVWCRRALAACVIVLSLAANAGPAGAAPGDVDVRVDFGDDCGSAVVRAADAVSELLTVFSDGRDERIGDLPRAASYIVRIAPAALESGLTISALYVHAGEPDSEATTHARLLTTSLRFECDKGAHRLPRPHANTEARRVVTRAPTR